MDNNSKERPLVTSPLPRKEKVLDVVVHRREGESVENLSKRFYRKVMKAGIINDINKHMYYEKPSNKRRRVKIRGINNFKRKMEKMKELEEFDSKKIRVNNNFGNTSPSQNQPYRRYNNNFNREENS